MGNVKIGALVHVQGEVRINDANSGAGFKITNLPFVAYNPGEGAGYAAGTVGLYDMGINSGYTDVICSASPGTTNLFFQCMKASGNNLPNLEAVANGYVKFSIVYRTSA